MLKSAGWKGKAGALLVMAYAAIGVAIGYLAPESNYGHAVSEAIPMFGVGLAALGIRLKLG